MNVDSLTLTLAIFIGVIGLVIGSFLNVVALRGLSGESIVCPPSKCPKCQKQLNWYTNIPVLAYIFLGGKCQFCKEKISLQYPLVELSNAILYVIFYLNFSLSLKTLLLCLISSIFILICITDFKEQVIIDLHTYILIALGVIYNIFNYNSISIIESVLGIALGYLIFEILAHIGTLTVKTRAFGEGDTLIAMGLGAFFGAKTLVFVIFLSVLLQAIAALPMLIYKHFKQKRYKSAFALITTIFCLIAIKILDNFDSLYFYILPFILIALLWCLITIFKGIKNNTVEQNFFYMPFGPALIFAALIMIFYSKEILGFFV